jgi:hypothetical protein
MYDSETHSIVHTFDMEPTKKLHGVTLKAMTFLPAGILGSRVDGAHGHLLTADVYGTIYMLALPPSSSFGTA